jgi:hypothetical protein
MLYSNNVEIIQIGLDCNPETDKAVEFIHSISPATLIRFTYMSSRYRSDMFLELVKRTDISIIVYKQNPRVMSFEEF